MTSRIVALAGGVGAARFLAGLAPLVPPRDLMIVVNTGDDTELHGLHISPDLDTVTYTLAGVAHPQQGWGLGGDTFACLESLSRLGAPDWFRLGDRDLATHLYRTSRLRAGAPLSRVTQEIALALGVRQTILPMSDDEVKTRLRTPAGELEFQEYFVKRRHRDTVKEVRYRGASRARPAPRVLAALRSARGVVVCPSNPVLSIGPILAIPGVRLALRQSRGRVVAVSPLVAGRALRGPADRLMRSLGLRADAAGVAELYRDFLDVLVMDHADRGLAPDVRRLGVEPVITDTIMDTALRRRALARAVLELL